MALYKMALRNNMGTTPIITHISAANEDAAYKVIYDRGYSHMLPAVSIEEIHNPQKINHVAFNEFVGQFYSGKFPQQRFGQAFLNEFAKHYPLVDSHHYGGYLWEEPNTNIAIDKITGLDLIDWTN